jgi:dUTP pyrophosphatase
MANRPNRPNTDSIARLAKEIASDKRIKVAIKSEDGKLIPQYATKGSVGVDLKAKKRVQCPPGEVTQIGTGIYVEVPEGYELQIRARSGLAKQGLIVANAPGTIDSDYRGEIIVLMFNLTNTVFTFEHGERIAQAVLSPVARIEWERKKELGDTDRGNGGFGSTGK